jgi:predicted lipid carrier protein YhbT
MATVEECAAALRTVAGRLAGTDPATRGRIDERAVACRIRDLDVTFVGELRNGALEDIELGEAPSDAVLLSLSSDDLIALTDGRLKLAAAFATGRLQVQAGVRDLLKLRSFF